MTGCHDISDGGIIISVLEMCASKGVGFNFSKIPINHNYLFGEDQSRYLVAIDANKIEDVLKILDNNNIMHKKLGVFTNQNPLLIFPDKSSIKLDYILKTRKLWENRI